MNSQVRQLNHLLDTAFEVAYDHGCLRRVPAHFEKNTAFMMFPSLIELEHGDNGELLEQQRRFSIRIGQPGQGENRLTVFDVSDHVMVEAAPARRSIGDSPDGLDKAELYFETQYPPSFTVKDTYKMIWGPDDVVLATKQHSVITPEIAFNNEKFLNTEAFSRRLENDDTIFPEIDIVSLNTDTVNILRQDFCIFAGKLVANGSLQRVD